MNNVIMQDFVYVNSMKKMTELTSDIWLSLTNKL